jgi:hypothetical protein
MGIARKAQWREQNVPTMKNDVCSSAQLLRRVALVRTDVSEELMASIIRMTIGELGTTLAVTGN